MSDPYDAPGRPREPGPAHYTGGDVQPWDAMQDWMPPHQMLGFLRGNVIKYLARMDKKGDPLGDAQKAAHYARKMVAFMEEHCSGPGGCER